MIGFMVGLVVGAGAGFFVAALLAVASESDDRAERHSLDRDVQGWG